ncbi:AAA family ATPase [Alkalibaculum sp. M08DMB]|uniref:Shikimate kinase n=1 Tax=Alkalibaculum sporogenes TaxID=2655001 RepID=A0A6A7K703_9FIRM|nr:shikimate kinase [Alkalibaculum sporogenes]MPW25132.1 AAA family ATPase [Alkalibaculum sporogenes]
MEKRHNIALIGFMGTGKSTIGKKLATKLGYEFIDTDKFIEEYEDTSIKEIFSKYGESHFREKETEALTKIVQNTHQVISTGGGIILNAKNRKILMANCFVVHLTAKPRNIYFRIKNNKERPLLNTAHPERTIRQLLHKRYKYYRVCHYTIKTDVGNITSIVNNIAENYNNSTQLSGHKEVF